jgi:hypothetical protein
MATGRPKQWARKRGLVAVAAKQTTQTKKQLRRRRKQVIGYERRGGH